MIFIKLTNSSGLIIRLASSTTLSRPLHHERGSTYHERGSTLLCPYSSSMEFVKRIGPCGRGQQRAFGLFLFFFAGGSVFGHGHSHRLVPAGIWGPKTSSQPVQLPIRFSGEALRTGTSQLSVSGGFQPLLGPFSKSPDPLPEPAPHKIRLQGPVYSNTFLGRNIVH